jgi:hypothetical protein
MRTLIGVECAATFGRVGSELLRATLLHTNNTKRNLYRPIQILFNHFPHSHFFYLEPEHLLKNLVLGARIEPPNKRECEWEIHESYS